MVCWVDSRGRIRIPKKLRRGFGEAVTFRVSNDGFVEVYPDSNPPRRGYRRSLKKSGIVSIPRAITDNVEILSKKINLINEGDYFEIRPCCFENKGLRRVVEFLRGVVGRKSRIPWCLISIEEARLLHRSGIALIGEGDVGSLTLVPW